MNVSERIFKYYVDNGFKEAYNIIIASYYQHDALTINSHLFTFRDGSKLEVDLTKWKIILK